MSKTSRRHSNHSTEEETTENVYDIPRPWENQRLIRTKSDSVVLVT